MLWVWVDCSRPALTPHNTPTHQLGGLNVGNTEMASELLRLVSGDDEGLIGQDRFYSGIEEMADRITLR